MLLPRLISPPVELIAIILVASILNVPALISKASIVLTCSLPAFASRLIPSAPLIVNPPATVEYVDAASELIFNGLA